MRNAIADAGSQPADIGYVNAHGTGTPENDKMETLGMRAVFGDAPPPISSNKSMIGHTLSAAGAIEAAFSLLTIRDQVLPPTINHDEPDPAITLDVVPNVARPATGAPRAVQLLRLRRAECLPGAGGGAMNACQHLPPRAGGSGGGRARSGRTPS